MKQEKHIKFVFMIEKFGVMDQKVIKICVDLLSIGFFSFLSVKGIQMVQAVQYTYFPALGWSQLWLYLPLPLSAAFMLIYAVAFFARDIKNLEDYKTEEGTL